MGLFSRLKLAGSVVFGAADVVTGVSLEQLLRQWNAGQKTDAGVSVTVDNVLACSTVYACVKVLAETVGMLPAPVFRRLPNGSREQARDHPLWDILNHRPNPWQTAQEFREMLTGHLVLRGNAYAYVVRNILTGAVQSLVPLNPANVRPRQRPDFTIEYEYTTPAGAAVVSQQADVLHLRGLSNDGISGITPLTAFRNSVGIAMAAEKLHGKTFANGAKFAGVVKAKAGLSPAAIANLREDFGNLHGGDNAWKTPVLEEGMDWQQTGMQLGDAQLLETRQFQRSDIAAIYRVPLHLINGDTDTAKGWSTLEQQSTEFITFSMLPWFERWEQPIRRCLMTPAEQMVLSVEFNVDGLLRGDTTARYAAYNTAIMSGWINRNEVRQKENLNRVDGQCLDDYLSPMNMNKGTTGDPNAKPPAK